MTDEVVTTPEVQPEDTPQVSEQAAPVSEDQPQEVEATEPTLTEDEGQEQAPKQTRAEKRLHQLLERAKQPERDPYEDYLQSMPDVSPAEDGTITPEQLQQLVAKETAKNVALAREMDRYHTTVTEFTSEVAQVGEQLEKEFGDNKPLATKLNDMLSTMIEKANVRYDTKGQKVLVPSISPSQLYSQLKDALTLAQAQGQEKTTATMAKQLAEGAVTPSIREKQEIDASSVTSEQLWKDPGSVRKALEAKLQVATE